MIVVTGAAGFIASNLLGFLNNQGITEIIPVDLFNNALKNLNLEGKKYREKVDRDVFFDWLKLNHRNVEYIFHLGARTDTAEFDKSVFEKLNLGYSKKMWTACTEYEIPLIYASSAATYGNGELGYDDNNSIIEQLKPLNAYGESKNEFDKWVVEQHSAPPFWAALKFFNVYGPNEYHKNRMASVIFHAYHQIRQTGGMKLFRSHRSDIQDGCQSRDFVYVKDVVDVIYWLFRSKAEPGIYNLGTGTARTFLDLTKYTFYAMNLQPVIEFIDTPADIRDKYQYFTQANMNKIRSAGYSKDFTSLEKGINDYVRNYLLGNSYY
jgi:ADP-L-glycero-D-manno-heptose 6-epimerase